MTGTRAFHCPTCGAPTDEAQRLCSFCKSPVATVRCGACYHMNIPDALHCSGCGRELGLEPLALASELMCPDCKVSLGAFHGQAGNLFDCGRCGGQFVEARLLCELLEQHEVYGPRAPQRLRRENPLSQPVRYLPCPSCAGLMHRKNFGGTSGIIVDLCAQHGTWLDAGELPRVLAFVRQGGLARARQLEDERRRRAARDRATARAAVPAAGSAETNVSLLTDAADLGVGLLHLVTEIFTAS